MMLAILVMMMYEVKGNDCDILVDLVGMSEVMGIHLDIALVCLVRGYE